MTQSPPTVSVLICTRNRADELIYALRSIFANRYEHFTVSVVDQSDGYETREVVERFQAEGGGGVPIRYIRTETRGTGYARNVALTEATGEIVAFTDDDCLVGTDWVESIARKFRADSDLMMLYGQVLMPDEAKGNADVVVPCLYFDEYRELRKGDIFGMTANMALRREVVSKIGNYDVALGAGGVLGGASEDFDFTYRAQLAGLKVVADPEISVIHKSLRTREHWNRVTYIYGRGDAAFYGKHARCGDAWARRAILTHGTFRVLRHAWRVITGKNRITDRTYIHGFFDGLKQSGAHAVDRPRRLYVLPNLAPERGGD